MIEAARNELRWHGIARQMLHAWDDGMASVRSVRRDGKYRGLKADIAGTRIPLYLALLLE